MDPVTHDSDKENQDDVFDSESDCQSGSGSGNGSPTHSYTRDQLVEIRKLPLSKKRPDHLSVDFQNDDGMWDPEMWMRSFDSNRERKRSIHEEPEYPPQRRFVDPKERLKEEARDGIVLSPQRKSFMTGCHVTTGQGSSGPSRGRDPESPSDARESGDRDRDRRDPRDLPQRRIGSGRLTIDRERFDERRDERRDDRRFDDRRRDDWRRDDRGDRHRREEWTDYNGHNRHDRIRRRSHNHMSESEPEWFTAGPNSQSDTIELRGFNEPKEENQPRERSTPVCISAGNNVREDVQSAASDSPVIELPVQSPKLEETPDHGVKVAPSPGADFDINELFNMDISGIRGGPSPVEGQTMPSGSRFSRWFTHQPAETASGQSSGPVNMDYDPIEDLLAKQQNRRAFEESLRHDLFGGHMPMGHGAPPGLSPDSPHGLQNMQPLINSIMGQDGPHQDRGQSPSRQVESNLKAMLLANQKPLPDNRATLGLPNNRFKTVSELEAGLQDSGIGSSPAVQHRTAETIQQPMGSEMSAFNKLVGMMKMSGSLPESQRESPSLHQQQNMGRPLIGGGHEMNNKNRELAQDLMAAKLEQQNKQLLQQQLQAKLLQHQETMARQNPTIITKPASPVPPLIGGQAQSQAPPMLASPNPNLLGQANTPRAPSPIMFGQQPPLHLNAPSPVHPGSHGGSNQNLSVNSLQVNSGSHSPVLARVPSPQELVYHTQAIMQNALIKKQLEDQKERYIKKQQRDRSPCEMGSNAHLVMPQAILAKAGVPISMGQPMAPPMGQSMAPSMGQPMGAPPGLMNMTGNPPPPKATTAFTPTSVIKKMAVERSNSKEKLMNKTEQNMDGQDEAYDRSYNVKTSVADGPVVTDPSRVMAVHPMPQQMDVRVRRALVGSGSMKGMNDMGPGVRQGPPPPTSLQNRPMPTHNHMYQGPGGLTPMPTAIPRLNAPISDKGPPKSPLLGRQAPMGYGMPLNRMGAPISSMSNNHLMHLQSLQSTQNTARVSPMNHPAAMGQMNLHGLGGVDPRQVRGFPPPISQGHRMGPMPGLQVPSQYGRAPSPQAPLMNTVGPQSPDPSQGPDNSLAKWFGGMDMLKQHMPSMPSLPSQGQKVLTVDEIERRQQVVS